MSPEQFNGADCTLAHVLITARLAERLSRAPDYKAEASALASLAHQLTANAHGLLHSVVETAAELCSAGSAGISILEHRATSDIFRCIAVHGAMSPSLNSALPLNESPCGVAIAHDAAVLFDHPHRYFSALRRTPAAIVEALVAPFRVDGDIVGTLWAVTHDERRFDGEDARLLTSLARFAAAAAERARNAHGALSMVDAEAALRESESRLAVELADTQQLQRISSLLIKDDDVESLYDRILETARSLMRSQKASLQRILPQSGGLWLMAQHGFAPESAAYWQSVPSNHTTSCGQALARGEAVIVADVEQWPVLRGTQDLEEYRRSDVRAVLSTPLVSRDGHVVGVMSTHWHDVHQPSDRELRLLDVLARQTADLIERSSAHEALRRTNERFRIAEAAANGFVYDWNVGDGLVTRSDGFSAVLGYGPGEVDETASAWINLIHPDDRGRVELTTPATLGRERDGYVAEYRVRHKDGRYIHVLDSGVAMRDDDGTIVRVVGSTVDNTEPKRRARQQEFLVTLNDAIGPLSDALDIQRAAMRVLGEQLHVDRVLYAEFSSDGREYCIADNYVAPGITKRIGRFPADAFASVIRRSAGGEIAVISDLRRTSLLTDAEKQRSIATGIQAVATVPLIKGGTLVAQLGMQQTRPREWTADEILMLQETAARTWAAVARARAEAALRDSEERLRTVIESIKDYAIFTLDVDGRITSWNDGARRLKQYDSAEVIGKPVSIFYTLEDAAADKPAREMQTAVTTGRCEDESWRVRKDGSRFWVNEIMRPLRAADGRVAGFTKISRDLTERKAFEDALQRAHDSLELRVRERTAEVEALFQRLMSAQEEERRRIARDIHDQLGQQMTAVRINLDALRSHTDGSAALQQQAEKTQRLAEELDHSIDFLTWELRPAALDHLGLTAALRHFVKGWSERFGIPAAFEVAGDGDARLPSDVEVNLYRLVQEALHNVVKHAAATHVSVLVGRKDQHLVLVVEDNGRGFDPSAIDGIGLGLANMRERGSLAGGQLDIESTPGAGTSIFVHVPITDTP